ncbi:MAG: SulP family inorganic anion transporter [Rhodospirillales bacterium]|nr:SulP family inorganic anion transporter [Rhodospirillales bacterium]
MRRRLPARSDLFAGLLLAAVAIPEQLATARLAGLPPETGLFAALGGGIGFAAFGTNRFLSAGADSTVAPIFASGLAALAAAGLATAPAAAGVLALLVGALLVAAALLRLGWIADLLSIPVVTGLFAGIAVHIAVGQMPAVLGVAAPDGPLLTRALALLQALPDANPWTLGIGIGVVLAMQAGEAWAPRWPVALLAVLAAAAALWLGGLDARGVAVVGALPAGLPIPAVPMVSLAALPDLVPLALIVALVCMMQTAAVLRAYPSRPGGPFHVARDFGGIGAGCLLAGLLGGFPVNASPPRTALAVHAGGQTRWVGVVVVVLTGVALLGAGASLAIVPQAALAGILLSIALRLTRLHTLRHIALTGGTEVALAAAAALLVVVLPIEAGMIGAILLSLLHSVAVMARPRCVELARAPGTTVWWPPQGEAGEYEPGVLVFAAAAPLSFTNAAFVRSRLDQAIAQHRATRGALRLVVLEASGVTSIDYTAASMLLRLIETLRRRGIAVALARLSGERAQAEADRSGVLAAFGPDHVFRSVEDAVRAVGPRASQKPTDRAEAG